MAECGPLDSRVACAGACARCGARGVTVELQTVKAVLTETALRRIRQSRYGFCARADCPVVYFGEGGDAFGAADLRVPVWQKQPSGARLLCYCFGETDEGIRAELAELGRSDAAQRIRAHIAAGRCACEVRNPRGSCCLGDVMAAIRELEVIIPRSGGTR